VKVIIGAIKVDLQKPVQSAQDEQSKKELNPEKELAILGAIELFIGFNSRFFAGSITSCAKEAIFLGIASAGSDSQFASK
jgi:hypothetical protein